MTLTHWLRKFSFAVLSCGAIALSAQAQENSSQEYDLEIDALPLMAAVKTLSDETGIEVLYFSEVAEGITSSPVKGEYTPTEALETMLASTDLEVVDLDQDGAVAIRPTKEASEPGKSQPASSPVLMAQNQTSAKQANTNQSNSTSSDADKNRPIPLEEIVVTGTHIRGVANVGAASISFNREELDNTSFSTVEEVFKSLPQNLAEIGVDGVSATGVSDVAVSNTQLASGISLRGLGPGSTLVLLNGKRRPGNMLGRVVDLSAIPLSMIERIDVVTGGRSAIYGSDAVAGVVNMVTRTEFDGAETQVYYGEASEGGEKFNFSQSFGREFEKGGFVLGYDYSKGEFLDVTATGVVRAPSPFGITPIPGLFPARSPSEQHVGLFAGHFEVTNKVELYADAQFSVDENDGGQAFLFDIPGCCSFDQGSTFVTDSDQYSAVAGIRADFAKGWQVDVSGLHGVVDGVTKFGSAFGPGGTVTSIDLPLDSSSADEAVLTSFSVIADGPLGQFKGETVSAAVGVDYRNESFERVSTDFLSGLVTPQENLDRDVWSVFGEIHLALIKSDAQRLEVSLAGRYDDYSDVGDTFNPQIGIEWEPAAGIVFRGSYSEAFRAPDLFTLGFGNQVVLNTLDDPLAPGTPATVFVGIGGKRDLQPELADTYTLGIDWEPSDSSKLSLTYFSIEYEGRIDAPAVLTGDNALEDEALFAALINRNPTATELEAVLDRSSQVINLTGVPFDPVTDDPFVTFPNIVIFDNRRNNIGLEQTDGVDFQASAELDTNSGIWSLGLSGTYIFDYTRNIIVGSPTIDQLNRPGRPVDFKARGHIEWSRSAWGVNAYLNYVDSYDDTLAATPTKIDSWTTVDLTLRFVSSEIAGSGFFEGTSATLGIINLFDEDPPEFLNNSLGLGFDGANANPIGRFVSLRLSKRW